MPGPVRKHPSVRRRADLKTPLRSLPAAGRTGKVPPWPLKADVRKTSELEFGRDRVASLQVQVETETDGRKRGRLRRELNKWELQTATLALQIEQSQDEEKDLWATLWATPQAVMWEEARAEREVAQYVRWKIRAEQGDVKAATEARQLSDRLGLNPLALLRLRAEVERVEEAEDRGQRRRQAPKTRKKSDGPDSDPRTALHVV